ncbi:MAG: substrate-binding domain-containing protein [Devosia nanyangense]|nr:substrate-binding domain-containing protein [Devosia nanyangense]
MRFMSALVILKAVEDDLLPSLAGPKPELIWDPTAALMARIEQGERADGIFAIDGSMHKLVDAGLLDPASIVPVVQAEFGIAVSLDMPMPKLENADDLIVLLLSVPTLCYSRAGASGIYFETLIDRLGIGDTVRAKSLVIPAGLTAEQVRKGRAVLAVQQMSELRAVDGVRIVGPLPPDCQQKTDFSAGVFADATEPEAAREFIATLTSPEARAVYLDRGLNVRF